MAINGSDHPTLLGKTKECENQSLGDKGLEFSESLFNEPKEYIFDIHGEANRKGGWTAMAYPVYRDEILVLGGQKQNNKVLGEIKDEIISEQTHYINKIKATKHFDQFISHCESVIGATIDNPLNLLNPTIIEAIPEFHQEANKKKTVVKKLYTKMFERYGLSVALNPLCARVLANLRRPKVPGRRDPKWMHTCNEQINTYVLNMKARALGSIETRSYNAQSFFLWVAKKKYGGNDYSAITWQEISNEDIEGYKDHLRQRFVDKEITGGTANNKWNYLKDFNKLARDQGWTKIIVGDKPGIPVEKKREPKVLSDSQITQLFNGFLDDQYNALRDLTIMAIEIDSGPRIGELLKVTSQDIHVIGSRFAITVSSKGFSRTFLLSGPASLIFSNYLTYLGPINPNKGIFDDLSSGKAATVDNLRKKFDKYRGSISDGAWHLFRHTFITRALEMGAPQLELANNLWANPSFIMVYDHPSDGRIDSEGKKFPSLKGLQLNGVTNS